jgi:hypothetical protein
MGKQKYMQMAAYLFELGYELALACRDNVSDSPGFEGCGLIFDKTGWKKDQKQKAELHHHLPSDCCICLFHN